MVAVLKAGHSLPADEKEVVLEEGHNRYVDEREVVQQGEHSHCADAKAAGLAEEHNHHAAAADVPEAVQLAAHSLPVAVSQEAVPEEERSLHVVVADTAADMMADVAVDTAAGPGSGIPTGLPLPQPIRSAARYTDSSSHPACPRDSAPASVEDHWSFHSDRQNTLLTVFRLYLWVFH